MLNAEQKTRCSTISNQIRAELQLLEKLMLTNSKWASKYLEVTDRVIYLSKELQYAVSHSN